MKNDFWDICEAGENWLMELIGMALALPFFLVGIVVKVFRPSPHNNEDA